ncbi:MAG: DUF3667 domain-containing protein [Dokdonella sp.]|uniref:DUF3667 domain-containing protein n=1 Tax=Dokdonella sp. TaxID=2291710 RepID=UPI003262EA4B
MTPETSSESTDPVPTAAVPPAREPKPPKACANCGAPMHGPYCYACGQPEKGMIRHLASVMADVADTIFNVDSRIFRSILPLYFRPGFLTLEYFAGRRTRYVTPFRLFFVLCVVSFFAIQINLNLDGSNIRLVGDGNTGNVDSADSAEDVQTRMQAGLDGLAKARATPGTSVATKQFDRAEADIRKAADKRLKYLAAKQDAIAKGQAPPRDPTDGATLFQFDDVPWDPVASPIHIGWLPAFANAKLNDMAQHASGNLKAARKDPGQAIARLFSVLPQTLFVLMPLFAVLLKIMYLFKRRLYMEHLMVALHSHAFIFMSLLLLAIVQWMIDWAGTSVVALVPPLDLVRAAIWTWLPIYLLLMQKKVYRQGWFFTTFKYSIIGVCYLVILGFGLAGAAIFSLTLT